MPVLLATLVGFWSLCGQFILNRIIFFYVANSEYAAASIISLHLLGFLLGSMAARRWPVSLSILTAASLAVTVLAQRFLWTWGVAVFGLIPTLVMALVFALALAFFSGYLVIRLMEERPSGASSTPIIVADSAGSVVGAMVGGFILIPKLGLQGSFALMTAMQAGVLLLLTRRDWRRLALAGAAVCLAALPLMPGFLETRRAEAVLTVEGLPLQMKSGGAELIFERRSPFGILSVLENDEKVRELRIDNRGLCGVSPDDGANRGTSEWIVGEVPVQVALKQTPRPRVAVVGLGCGMTLAAALDALRAEGAAVDVIELNPEMEETQKLFREYLPNGPGDPRVKLVVRDAFAHFVERAETEPPYDAIAIDVAWMANMNATHLFSKEMYENVARHMTDRSVLGVWSEETSPFSPVSLIVYRTLKSVFQEVRVDASHGVVLFYAAKAAAPDLVSMLPEQSAWVTTWVNQDARDAPVNRLDDLAMNRQKFTLWGDSTFERLGQKYRWLHDLVWKQ